MWADHPSITPLAPLYHTSITPLSPSITPLSLLYIYVRRPPAPTPPWWNAAEVLEAGAVYCCCWGMLPATAAWGRYTAACKPLSLIEIALELVA